MPARQVLGDRGQWLLRTTDTFYTESRKERRLILRGAPLWSTKQSFSSLLIVSARLIRRQRLESGNKFLSLAS